MRLDLLALLLLLAAHPSAQGPFKRDGHEMHGLHRDSKSYIAMLEDPKREAYQKPDQVVAALDLQPGEVIADIGAGSGYFSFRFGRQVGERGRVYAVDVSPDMILHMNRRIRELGVTNIVTVLSAPDDPLLGEGSRTVFLFVTRGTTLINKPSTWRCSGRS